MGGGRDDKDDDDDDDAAERGDVRARLMELKASASQLKLGGGGGGGGITKGGVRAGTTRTDDVVVRAEMKNSCAKEDEMSGARTATSSWSPVVTFGSLPPRLMKLLPSGFSKLWYRGLDPASRFLLASCTLLFGALLLVTVLEEGFDKNPEPAPYQPPAHPALKALYHPVYHAKRVSAETMAGISKGFLGNFGRPTFTNEAAREAHPWSKTLTSSVQCAPPACVNVVDHGAIGDGLTLNTDAIARALAAAARASAAAGGIAVTVAFPVGRWLTGPIELVSKVTIVLDGPRCQIEAMRSMTGWPTQPYKEHPSLPSSKPHRNFRAFIHGYNLTDIGITGGGIVHGHGDFWWPKGKKTEYRGEKYHVPNLVHLVGCVNVRISGVTFKSSPHFTLRPQYCTDVDIDHVRIENDANSHGTNGVVFDSTRRATLSDAFIDTGNKEDAVAIKSGEDEEGRARSIPSRDITVSHVTVHGGHAISVGSEMSGGVYNIVFRDITFDGRGNGFGVGSARIKTQRGRGGTVDGVTFQNIHGYNALYALELYEYYTGSENVGQLSPIETPVIRNVVMRNVNIDGVHRYAGVIAGLPEAPIDGLVLENIHLKNVKKGGWECKKFKECNWQGGGCAYGTVRDVTPGIPDGCVLPSRTGGISMGGGGGGGGLLLAHAKQQAAPAAVPVPVPVPATGATGGDGGVQRTTAQWPAGR